QPGNVHVANADLSNDVELTSNDNFKSKPSWSPDGAKLAFSETLPDITAQVVVMNPDGSGSTSLGAGASPIWSPDGTKFVFNGSDGIWTMNADGSNRVSISTPVGGSPDWQPIPAPPPPPPPSPQAPTNSTIPTIAGTPKTGQTLTAEPGSWNG